MAMYNRNRVFVVTSQIGESVHLFGYEKAVALNSLPLLSHSSYQLNYVGIFSLAWRTNTGLKVDILSHNIFLYAIHSPHKYIIAFSSAHLSQSVTTVWLVFIWLFFYPSKVIPKSVMPTFISHLSQSHISAFLGHHSKLPFFSAPCH